MTRFVGQTVLVTGAARGLGRRTAERFAAEGAALVISDVLEAELAETAAMLAGQGARVVAKPADVAEEATASMLVEAALATSGRLDVAINNAGVAHPNMKLPALPLETLERMLRVNVVGVFLGLRAQIPAMERQGGGAILNVSSAAGVNGAPLLSAYAASKHAVIGLTKSAALECARKGVRINAICPAFAATDMVLGELDTMRGGPEEGLKRVLAAIPAGRLATLDEVVEGMLFLCRRENSFMTGHALIVDGGLSAA